jgi:hypothetical protein
MMKEGAMRVFQQQGGKKRELKEMGIEEIYKRVRE